MAWNPLEHLRPVPQKPINKLPRVLNKTPFPYAFTGGYAVQHYIAERDCYRLDFLTETQHREIVQQFFKKHSRHTDKYADTHDFYILKRSKIYIGVINSPADWVTSAINQAQDNNKVLPLQWLILAKMWTGDRQDFLDSARLIARAKENDFDQIKAIFEEYLPEALPELRELYKIGIAELKQNPDYQNKPNSYSAWHKMNAEVNTEE